MKVLYITDPGIVGGATRSLIDVASSMSDKGIECIVCTSSYNELNEELNKLNIVNFASGHRAVMDIPAYKKWKRPFKKLIKGLEYRLTLSYVIRNIEKNVNLKTVDLIHTNSARNDIGCILAEKYNIPHIIHIREFGDEDFHCICYRRNYTKFLNKHTTVFIAISQAVKDAWIRKGLIDEKIKVIYNGVDNTKIVKADLSKSSIGTPLRMVIVGGVCEAKGQLQIVEAMGRLPERMRENVHLDIIGWGDPSYIGIIKDRAETLELSKNICFVGARDDIYSLLQNYQVGLMCSRAEGFGRVTAEYMHAGLGIIASDAGANRELICDGESGLVYKLNDYDDLARCIAVYYDNRAFLLKMATAAFLVAGDRFTKEENASRIFNLYKELEKPLQDREG